MSTQDNFFELGGHSLLAMKVTFQVEKELGIDVRPMELLLQSLAQFAEMCAKRGGKSEEPGALETTAKSWFSRLKGRLKNQE